MLIEAQTKLIKLRHKIDRINYNSHGIEWTNSNVVSNTNQSRSKFLISTKHLSPSFTATAAIVQQKFISLDEFHVTFFNKFVLEKGVVYKSGYYWNVFDRARLCFKPLLGSA